MSNRYQSPVHTHLFELLPSTGCLQYFVPLTVISAGFSSLGALQAGPSGLFWSLSASFLFSLFESYLCDPNATLFLLLFTFSLFDEPQDSSKYFMLDLQVITGTSFVGLFYLFSITFTEGNLGLSRCPNPSFILLMPYWSLYFSLEFCLTSRLIQFFELEVGVRQAKLLYAFEFQLASSTLFFKNSGLSTLFYWCLKLTCSPSKQSSFYSLF